MTSDDHHVRTVLIGGRPVGVVMQSRNGPCPLLAIVNVLSLRGRAKIASLNTATSQDLCNLVAEVIMNRPGATDDDQTGPMVNDALERLPRLVGGLDVNVGFDSISSFERDPSLHVFDLLQIPLVHGWIVDADDPARSAVTGLFYNDLVVKAVRTPRNNADDDDSDVGRRIGDFLGRTATQLTQTGLSALHALEDDAPCVFFRNNHFNVMVQSGGALYVLVTDDAFVDTQDVVWERIDSVLGATEFVDGGFRATQFASESARDLARRRSSLSDIREAHATGTDSGAAPRSSCGVQ